MVVGDLSMPGLDGRAVYRAIGQQPPPRPAVVFISGYADAGPYEEFLRTAQVPVVGKPFEINVLRETVRRMLSGR
jgi:CheY-like chemotaxis protein